MLLQLADNNTYTSLVGEHDRNGRRHFRMREAAGTLMLEAMNDAGVYQVLGSGPMPFRGSFDDIRASVGVGTYQPEATSSTVIWDNLNTP